MKILIIADAHAPDRRDFTQAMILARATDALVEVYVGDSDSGECNELQDFVNKSDSFALRREVVLEVFDSLIAPMRRWCIPTIVRYEHRLMRGESLLGYVARSRPDWLAHRGVLVPLQHSTVAMFKRK
jgi:hypothetical protein